MRKVIKVSNNHKPVIYHEYDNIYLLDSYYYRWPAEGKIAISVKVGKKRKLVSGRITSTPVSCRDTGLSYEHRLLTNSPKVGLLI